MGAHARKTKILATVGPSQRYKKEVGVPDDMVNTVNPNAIRHLMRAGVNVFRLNFSHGTHEDHAEMTTIIRKVALQEKADIQILGDLQGPKHRLGKFKPAPGEKKGFVKLREGGVLYLHSNLAQGFQRKSGTIHAGFKSEDVYPTLKVGQRVLMADAAVAVEIDEVGKTVANGKYARTHVLRGTELSDAKGVNFPDSCLKIDVITEKDLEDVKCMVALQVDKIALSFVQTADDIKNLKKIIRDLDPNYMPRIVAKIEKPGALVNIDEIARESNELMFARGDMGVEMPQEDLPGAKEIIFEAAYKHDKEVIIATQVLLSMTNNAIETRAETCGIWQHVEEGAAYIMLSEETANGNHPIAAVERMRINIERAEFKRDNPQKYREELNANLRRQFLGAAEPANSNVFKAPALELVNV